MRQNESDNQDTLLVLEQVVRMFSKIISCITERSDHFNEIKKFVSYLYEVKNWSILRLDENTNQLFFTILESECADLLKQIPVKVGEGVCGRVAATGKYEIITKIGAKHKFTKSIDNLTQFKTESIIAVPILYSSKVVGVLELINVKNPEIFQSDPNQLALLQTIANFIGVIFSLSNSHQEIIFSSERDSLTGLYNRFFLKKIIENVNEAQHPNLRKSDENTLLIVMADLNNFKSVNDNYGHLAGDNILKETANLLTSHFREEDLIVRYGGDEFIILIYPRGDIDSMIAVINAKLEFISLSLPYGCSVAFGISSGKKSDFIQLLQDADKLMYMHKQQKKLTRQRLDS